MKKKSIIIILLVVAFLKSVSLIGQENFKNNSYFYLHSLCDTVNNPSLTPFINHWIQFIYTENDSDRKKMWNPTETVRLNEDFALFYSSLFQYPAKSLLKYFKPYILSAYFEDSVCHIVTAFWNFNFIPSDSITMHNSNPFAILEVGLIQKNNEVYLTNLFYKRTSYWKKYTYGKIKYVYDPSIEFNYMEADKANNYIDSLSKLFLFQIDTITYVVCKSPQSLGYLLGFNFFYSGFTSGRAFIDGRLLISGNASFNYPHELTHLIFDPILKPGHFLSEGLATYFGGSSNVTYNQLLYEFKKKYKFITDKEFDEINKYPNSKTAYTLSAIIVDIILKKYGTVSLKKLDTNTNTSDEFILKLYDTFKMDKQNLFKEINKILK